MESDLGIKLTELKVDGGMISNNLLMQFQADILSKIVTAQPIAEITAFGSAVASYICINNFELQEMDKFFKANKSWTPNMSKEVREGYLSKWNLAIEKAKNWLE